MVRNFHDARDARDALRESGLDVGSTVAGTAGSNVAAYQLSDEEFAEAFPPLLFKDWLVSYAERPPEETREAS